MKNYQLNRRRQYYRKPGQDYSLPGFYFITMNTHNWQRLFGHKSADKILLNNIGSMIDNVWQSIPSKFSMVRLDEYIIMPDHFHAIVEITEIAEGASFIDPRDRTLAKIVGAFKSISTVRYIRGVQQYNWPRFQDKLWHFRFYDRIIKDQDSIERTRKYIIDNPINWNP